MHVLIPEANGLGVGCWLSIGHQILLISDLFGPTRNSLLILALCPEYALGESMLSWRFMPLQVPPKADRVQCR